MDGKLPKDKTYLVVDNLRLVHYLLQTNLHKQPCYTDYEDTFQEGCIGLILAAIRFDESKGFQFTTFASAYVLGYMRKYLRTNARVLQPTRSQYGLYLQVVELLEKGEPLDAIQEQLNISALKLNDILNIYKLDSLDRPIENSDGKFVSTGGLVADWRDSYKDLIFEKSLEDGIAIVLSKQKGNHRSVCEEWVWTRMFGDSCTTCYLSEKYKLSQSYISRILIKFKQDLLFYLQVEI